MGIMNYLSFIGASFIAAVLFGLLLPLFHSSVRLLSLLALILMVPLGVCAIPAIILSYPAKKYADRQLENTIRQDEYKKHQALIAIPNRLLTEAESKIERYEKLIAEDRKRCRDEGYQEGFSAASRQYSRMLDFDKFLEYKKGYIDGQSDHVQGINKMKEFEKYAAK